MQVVLSNRKKTAATLGRTLARELTPSEVDVVAGGTCQMFSYPPVTPVMCDPHEN